ncbi:kinase-like domain-containing protein [Phycomyces nitens]|nr:kinase-like domain-containing protein [Phycomyces nitens]
MAIKNITKSLRRIQKKDSLNPKSNLPCGQDALLHGIGPYTFCHALGNGKFSRVMLAKHKNGTLVAIKMIDKQAHDYRVMSRLVREIHLMEALDHESIVRLYETFETCDTLYLVMEYVPGCNLDEHLQKAGGSLSEDEARLIFRQLVIAVSYCHSRWVVHRDLKTPNVLVAPDGIVKLADFGLGNRFGLQRLRTICGSMLYYSPEIISGQKYYGPEVDCWCLGIALFRMTAGFEPFSHAHTVGELKKDVCSGNFPMPDKLSAGLQATIRKCLETDRRRRMTVLQALGNDPWLTDYGRLPCPVIDGPMTTYDASFIPDMASCERRTRRQHLRDVTDQNPGVTQRTLIFHPVNTSTYFTPPSSGSFSQHFPHRHPHIETLRTELLHTIRTNIHQLGMRPAERWETISNRFRSPILSPTRPKDQSFQLASVVSRWTKDRVYLAFLHNPGSSTASSWSSSDLLPCPVRTERDLMILLQQTCQLMGITYMDQSTTQLRCMFTLRDTPIEASEHSLTSDCLPNDLPTKRLSLPLLSHLTSSMTTSFFGRSRQNLSPPILPQKQKEGTVEFTIRIEYQKRAFWANTGDLYAIRFSKLNGSTTVFKVATGWVGRVLGLTI